MRVVVIGGTGYIGAAVVERLTARGDTPTVVSRSVPERLPVAAEAGTGDVREPQHLAGPVRAFDDAAAELGRPLAQALAYDQVVTSPGADVLGWAPRPTDALRSIVEEYAA